MTIAMFVGTAGLPLTAVRTKPSRSRSARALAAILLVDVLSRAMATAISLRIAHWRAIAMGAFVAIRAGTITTIQLIGISCGAVSAAVLLCFARWWYIAA